MTIPNALAAALAAADEEYLIGLSNRGTVNRAKKDLAALTDAPEAHAEDGGAEVRLGGAVCRIRVPLGESTCSCPSTAVCRHRIAAILWLKEQIGSAAPAAPAASGFAQLRAVPSEKLARQLGAKRLEELLARRAAGAGPTVLQGASTISVELPWIPATVRLLEPLEHSTCTCRSESFCVHKAEALLAWQLEQGIADVGALCALCPAEDGPDPETARRVCGEVRRTLTGQLAIGLSRMPPGTCETVERLASLAHTAGLPSLERALRGLHEEYAACLARSAAFRDEALLRRFARVFFLADAMERADAARLRTLAGTFRDEYLPAGRLELYLLGYRDVTGQSGYSGTVYYFWERAAHRFYTYSDLRPDFYERSARRRTDAAPWGLPCTLRKAWKCTLDLAQARVNTVGSLSGTTHCTASVLGAQEPGSIVPPEALCTDFAALLSGRSGPDAPETARLALILPARCEPQEYDRVEQRFSLRLLDETGHDLWVEVQYKKEEQAVVQTLERLAERLTRRPDERPMFFGVLYREGDRLRLYPIEVFPDWEVQP